MKISPDDRGFSLVELLVAIAMLGIIAAPLLHAFVTSAMTARKSYDMGELTLAAQTAAETVEADSMKAISAKALVSADGKQYDYTISDVGGKGRFDARITLSATPYDSVNSVSVTQYSPMDAVFSQPGGSSDPDALAAQQLSLDAIAAGGAVGKITRDIALSITEAGGNYAYACTYSYTASVNYPPGTDTAHLPMSLSYSAPYSFYTGKLGAATELTPLYFFFAPSAADTGVYDDHIVVTHTGGTTPVNVFLAAQQTVVDVRLSPYKALVDLKGSQMNVTRVYSNMVRYEYHVYDGPTWYERQFYNESLVTSQQVRRMFRVTIDICAMGETQALYTLTTSKLD